MPDPAIEPPSDSETVVAEALQRAMSHYDVGAGWVRDDTVMLMARDIVEALRRAGKLTADRTRELHGP